jgi:tetratricopeptide (TPR) repeat protein
MQSHFSSQTLAEMFRDLYLSEHTGVLELSRGDLCKKIYFERGLINYAESSVEQESLAGRLLQDGRVSAGALAEVGQQSEQPVELAQALLNRGLISKEAAFEAMRDIVKSVVESVFSWDGGTATFSTIEKFPEFFESDVLRTFELILRGILRMVGFTPIGEAMLGLDNKLRVRRQTPLPLERLALSPAHGFILSRVDGTITVKEVLSTLPPEDDGNASRFLFGLLIMGVLEYDPPLSEGPFRVANILRDHADRRALEMMQEETIQQVYSQMQSQDTYGVLGVSSKATRQAIERAYGEAKTLFSKERILPRVREKYRSELAVIESRLIEAYLRLTQPDRSDIEHPSAQSGGEGKPVEKGVDDFLMRVELDKTKSKVALEEAGRVAESYYSQARRAVREGDYHGAIQYGKLAVSYNSEDARYYFLLADCQARNPESRWQRTAAQNFAKATELDPWNVEYWMSLGRFYKKRGMAIRARKQFEEVLKLVPSHQEALTELESLG